MPQARRAGSGSRSSGGSARRTTGSSRAKATGTRSSTTSRAKATKATTSRAKSTKATSARSTKSTAPRGRAGGASAAAAEAQLEAAAQRLRKLNERIIQASREAGETTLTNYEKALKTIASTIERGPGSSDIEWVAQLASAQAKFIRDTLAPLTQRARKALK
jgi:hypothetical protein